MRDSDENIDWEALGRALREAREQAGTPADVAARQLCLGKNQILALESGASASFPGAEARAWCARRYAAQLGLALEDFGRDPASSARLHEAIPAVMPPAHEEPPAAADAQDVSPEIAQPMDSGIGKRIAIVIALVLLVAAGLLSVLSRPPALEPVVKAPPMAPLTPPPAPEPVAPPAAPPESVTAQPETPSPSAVSAKGAESPQAPVAKATTPVPPPPAAPAPAKPEPAALSTPTVEIAGIDAHKSSATVFVAAREPVLLIARRPGRGETPYRLEKGGAQRIPVAEDQFLRVAQGKDLDMFFQGRKVAPSVIETGQWLRFVPLKPAATP